MRPFIEKKSDGKKKTQDKTGLRCSFSSPAIEDEPFFWTKGKEFGPVSENTIEEFASLFKSGPLRSHEPYLHQTAVGL